MGAYTHQAILSGQFRLPSGDVLDGVTSTTIERPNAIADLVTPSATAQGFGGDLVKSGIVYLALGVLGVWFLLKSPRK